MTALYPLRFQPILKRAIWGGRRLQSVLGKPLPAGDDFAESWEIVDHGDDQSIVRFGALEGAPLSELLQARGAELLARHAPQKQFPLLLKFLDANRDLSLQVHPNDEQGALLDPPDLGKTEAWVILHAEPGALVYAGLKPGFDRDALAREVNRGATELCLHRFEPRAGDCVFIPAGVAHALGAGLVVAEIQQSSDTTFRLFDWNRLGADGKPRELHVQQALDTIDYQYGPVSAQTPQPAGADHVERLVDCDKFVLDRHKLTEPVSLGGDNTCRLLAVVEGQLHISGDPADAPLSTGQTALLPACLEATLLTPDPDATLLTAHLP